MNHRPGSIIFGLVVGLAVAIWSYSWITDPGRAAERQQQERAVLAAREHLRARLGLNAIEIVDPLAPSRQAGKAWIYPLEAGWEISGYYRRDADDRWHAFLAVLRPDFGLALLRVADDDPTLAEKAGDDPLIELQP